MIRLEDGKMFDDHMATLACTEINTSNSDVYSSEEELITDLEKIYIPKGRKPFTTLYKGYEYIYSFAYYVQKGWTLSSKQMTQCKRLAAEIRKAAIVSAYIR